MYASHLFFTMSFHKIIKIFIAICDVVSLQLLQIGHVSD